VSSAQRGPLLIAAATFASAVLVVVYLAAGGASYEPTPVADPCAARDWTAPHSLEEDAQQFLLSTLDGAACELGVSRETLAAALATEESRDAFAAEQGIDDDELEAAVRAGLVRAIDDAQDAGQLNPLVAQGLRTIASNLPVDQAIDLINGAQDVFGDAGGLLDRLGGVFGDGADILGGIFGRN
jgi:hypothetical protein